MPAPVTTMKPERAARLGPIKPGVSYPLPEFAARAGLGSGALRQCRRAGLKVRYVCGRAYVKGDDWIAFVEENGKATKN